MQPVAQVLRPDKLAIHATTIKERLTPSFQLAQPLLKHVSSTYHVLVFIMYEGTYIYMQLPY